MTKFFEPINVSATHIYHSALELFPLSSIFRKLYYHQRLAPFPRVETGILDSHDSSISTIPRSRSSQRAVTWSPCGQFVAKQEGGAVEIRNALTFELVFTLQPSKQDVYCLGTPSYPPDGHSLACATNTGILIWDIQTGGVVREIQYIQRGCDLLVWSSNGEMLGVLFGWEVQIQNVVSDAVSAPIKHVIPNLDHFWAHNEYFWIMRSFRHGEARVLDIFEIGLTLRKIESFYISENEGFYHITSFSPTTYRASCRDRDGTIFFILDIQNSEKLLAEKGAFDAYSFSPDGSCFAAYWSDGIHTWKFDDSHYVPWRQFPSTFDCIQIAFSPTLSSIAVLYRDTLELLHFNHSPATPTIYSSQLKIFSPSGTHIATACYERSVITITNLSQTPFQTIDTGVKIAGLGLTGNVLLVRATRVVMAWLLKEEEWVGNVLDEKSASSSDSIWTLPLPRGSQAKFLVEGGTGVISGGKVLFIYNARTGEVLETTQEPSHFYGPWYSFQDNLQAKDHHNDHSEPSTSLTTKGKPTQTELMGDWIKDDEGKCLLWLPTEWRVTQNKVQWFPDTSTIKFKSKLGKPIIIKFQ